MLLTTLILTFLSIFSIEIQSNLKSTAFYENSFKCVVCWGLFEGKLFTFHAISVRVKMKHLKTREMT